MIVLSYSYADMYIYWYLEVFILYLLRKRIFSIFKNYFLELKWNCENGNLFIFWEI